MDLKDCTETLRARMGDASGLDASLKFDCGTDGVLFVDARSVPHHVNNADLDADCTVRITLENLSALLSGKLDPMTGFMTGKFQVEGDMGVAMKLQRLV